MTWLRGLLLRVWRSPVLMTWGASGARSLNILLILPLVVTRLEAPEIALWYLFATLIQLQLLADFGFSPTFVRVFAYAVGGAGVHDLADQRRPGGLKEGGGTNWDTIEKIWGTVRTVYGRLTIGAAAGLILIGTPFIWGPAMQIEAPGSGLLAWAVILSASTVILRGNAYSAYLNGLDEVALVRRWDAVMSILASLTQAVVLFAGGGILGLTLAHQSWMVLGVLRNRFLARHVADGRLARFAAGRDDTVFAAVWPSAWRSGIGQAMGNLPIQMTGLFYAQVATPVRSAEYLVSLNVLSAIRGFALAPFYSRLPLMARLRVGARLKELAEVARRGMLWSYWTFAMLHLGLGLFGEPILEAVGANADLVPPSVWAAFGIAFLLERYGAMHLHLYSTTNHIVWHKANGVSGALIIAIAAATFPLLDMMAFPLSIILVYLLFYVPFVVPRSLASLGLSARSFDVPALAGPFVAALAYAALAASGYFG